MNGMNIIGGKEYTNEQAHRLMWNWLAENPSCEKYDFFVAFHVSVRNEAGTINQCFACSECGADCRKCPIEWGDKTCDSPLTEYKLWLGEDLAERSRLAKIIAEKEWKSYGNECD